MAALESGHVLPELGAGPRPTPPDGPRSSVPAGYREGIPLGGGRAQECLPWAHGLASGPWAQGIPGSGLPLRTGAFPLTLRLCVKRWARLASRPASACVLAGWVRLPLPSPFPPPQHLTTNIPMQRRPRATHRDGQRARLGLPAPVQGRARTPSRPVPREGSPSFPPARATSRGRTYLAGQGALSPARCPTRQSGPRSGTNPGGGALAHGPNGPKGAHEPGRD